MFGLVVFGGIAIYFLLSIFIIIMAVSWADHYKKPPGKVGFIAALIVFGPVLWDFIPVHAVYNYQCKVNAGFTVHKTLEQWMQENPGVAETLNPIEKASWIRIGNLTRVPLNQRFIWEFSQDKVWYVVERKREKIIDIETNETLAYRTDFSTNIKPFAAKGWRHWKFWLAVDKCQRSGDSSKWLVNDDSFISFKSKVKHINGVIK